MESKRKNIQRRWLGLGLGGMVAVMLVAVVLLAQATPSLAQTPPTTPSTTTPSTNTQPNQPSASPGVTDTNKPGNRGGPQGGKGGFPGGFGGELGGFGKGGDRNGMGGETLTAINGSTLSLQSANGTTRTVTVDANTQYVRAGKTASLADFKVGEQVRVGGPRNNTTNTTTAVTLVQLALLSARGTVTAVNGTTLSIQEGNYFVGNVKIADTATVTRLDKDIKASDIKVGDKVSVQYQRASDGTLNGLVVRVEVPSVGGTVSAVNGNSLTITVNGNNTYTITTDGSTSFLKAEQTAALSDIKVGTRIQASGTQDATNRTLKAEQVKIETARAGGTVASVDGSNITVNSNAKQGRGPANGTNGSTTTPATTTTTIKTDSNTKFYTNSAPGVQRTAAALSDIKAGSIIEAEGTLNSDGTFTALVITIRSANSK